MSCRSLTLQPQPQCARAQARDPAVLQTPGSDFAREGKGRRREGRDKEEEGKDEEKEKQKENEEEE